MTKLESHRRERYPLLVIRISAFLRHSSFARAITLLAERTLFGFLKKHGNAINLVRAVGLQDRYAERKSSARRSVVDESCLRNSERRTRRAQTCWSNPGYARPFRSRRRCG